MLKLLLTLTTAISLTVGAKAQYSEYGAVDNFFMANPDLANANQYAGRVVNPNYILVDWDNRFNMDGRMTQNGFVRLGVSNWEGYNADGGGVPAKDLAIAYAHTIGADIIIYSVRQVPTNSNQTEHYAAFYVKPGKEVRRAAPAQDNPAVLTGTEASKAMNWLQDQLGKTHVTSGVWYDTSIDSYVWIGPKFGRRMTMSRSEFNTEVWIPYTRGYITKN